MLIEMKSPLKFILKDNLLRFDLITENGASYIVSDNFKQMVKASEVSMIKSNLIQPVVFSSGELPDDMPDEIKAVIRGRKRKIKDS